MVEAAFAFLKMRCVVANPFVRMDDHQNELIALTLVLQSLSSNHRLFFSSLGRACLCMYGDDDRSFFSKPFCQ